MKPIPTLTATLAAAAAATLAAALAACSHQTQNPTAPIPPVAVRTAIASTGNITETLLFTGELESPLSVDLAAKVSGRLAKLERKKNAPIIEGTDVRKGDILATLENRDLEAAVSLAGAQVQAAEVTLADRERERRRTEALFAENVATEQARDAAVTAHESAKAALAQAQAQLKSARVTLEESFIHSPMNGVVAKRFLDPGAMAPAGAPILQIVQMNPLKLMVSVPARMLPLLTAGKTPATVRTDVYPDRLFPCILGRVFPTVDTATRTAQVEILLPNEHTPDGHWLLLPGMYATAEIRLLSRQNTITVPADAITRVLDRQILFLLDGNIARAVNVSLGIREGERVEILSGLRENQEYVVMGQNKLTDGATVERVNPLPHPQTPNPVPTPQ